MDDAHHDHGFSHSSMLVLTSICDTFVPSLPFPPDSSDASPTLSLGDRSELLQDIAAFYQLSAASDGIPQQVAAAMARYLRPADVESVKSLLRLLGTRVGTWAMAAAIRLRGGAGAGGGGAGSMVRKTDNYDKEGDGDGEEWPVARFAAFHRLPLAHRQAILRGWALGLPLSSFTIPFLLFKVFILRQFYYKVDAHGQNPVVWKAIGYCGPDPRHASVELDECDRVLESRIVDMSNITPQEKRMLRSEFGMKITAMGVEDTISHRHNAGKAAGSTKDPKDDKKNIASCPCIFSNAASAAESDGDDANGDNKGRSVGGTATKQESRSRAKQDSKKAAAAVVRVEMKADVVIVGSGSGGSVVAAKLAEAGYKVIIMEKGGYLRRTENPLLEGKASTELYEQASNLATDDMGVFIFAGATVGGGSTVNWSASFKTPEHVREEWVREEGLEVFGSEGYRRAMEEVCRRIGVAEEEEEEESLANAMLRKGCQRMGIEVGRVPRNNGANKHHCGWCGMGCKAGLKNGATRTWLVDAARRGAVILAGCEGRRVKTERYDDGGGSTTTTTTTRKLRAKGVEARVVGGGAKLASRWLIDVDEPAAAAAEVEVHVEAKIVVASSGSLHTPLLLRRSGLLNPHIGLHLRLHPVMFIWAHFPHSLPHLTSYHGPIMSSFSPHAAHWHSSGYGSLLMVPSLHPAAFSAATPWLSPRSSKDSMLRFSKTAFLITITRDSGAGGRVFEDRSGHLHVSYELADADREHAVEAACLGFRILAAAGAAAIGTTNLDGASLQFPRRRRRNDGCKEEEELHDKEEEQRRKQEEEKEEEEEMLEEFISGLRHAWLKEKRPTVMGSAHQMGSCRMGKDPANSVVDMHGQTWEAKGLFVADASVFPTASGVNPMVTVQSIAFSIAHSILQSLH